VLNDSVIYLPFCHILIGCYITYSIRPNRMHLSIRYHRFLQLEISENCFDQGFSRHFSDKQKQNNAMFGLQLAWSMVSSILDYVRRQLKKRQVDISIYTLLSDRLAQLEQSISHFLVFVVILSILSRYINCYFAVLTASCPDTQMCSCFSKRALLLPPNLTMSSNQIPARHCSRFKPVVFTLFAYLRTSWHTGRFYLLEKKSIAMALWGIYL
jgi:hypothetical protein